jgi:hypothetical protein
VNSVDRRQLLSLCLLLMSGSAVPMAAGRAMQPRFISAASDREDHHGVSAFDLTVDGASPVFRMPLPGRGHHVAIHPSGSAFVAVARRPGNWLVVGDTATGKVLQTLHVPADRHCYGHGVFSADGRYFYTTESEFDNRDGDSGYIGVWLVSEAGGEIQLERIAQYPTHGVGPHELVLMPDGMTLAVANGGMRTHPDSEREVLNADSMLPSLAYLEASGGKLIEQRFLPEAYHQCSIRHLDVNSEGLVAFGMQFQGEPWQQVPLVATHQRGEDFRLLLAEEPVQGQMQQYVGSVRFSADGTTFMASCPRGNQLTLWDAATGKLLDSVRSRDGCGISAMDGGFLYTSGTGRLALYDVAQREVQELEAGDALRLMWDNHLAMV